MTEIAENISGIQQDILRLSPYPEKVKVVAVTKRFSVCVMRQSVEAGIRHLGENRMQEALEKFESEPFEGIIRHFVGTLQSNKIQKLVDNFHWLHSLEKVKHGRKIHEKASPIQILIQVNTTGERTKGGVKTDELEAFVKALKKEAPSLQIRGLMTMGPLGGTPEEIRASFRLLRKAGEALRSLETENFSFREYSMGMSGDYAIALEEGATFLRIGQGIFGPRPEEP